MGFIAKPGDSIIVAPLDVPYIPQKRQMSCWYACAKMLFKYKHGADVKAKRTIVGTEVGREVYSNMQKSGLIGEEESGVGATEREWPTVAQAFGLTPLGKDDFDLLDQSADNLAGTLRTRGPLWCAGRFFQGGSSGGHVIVVVGMITRKFMNRDVKCVVFHDPGPASLQGGPFCVKQYDNYFKYGANQGKKGIYSLRDTNDVSPVMYTS